MEFKEFLEKYQTVPVEHYPNIVKSNPIVSVCVVTFQHVDYIQQCLDSILMQETNFDFEILLGDDASTDGTREICIEYAEKYPDKIKLFLHRRENNIAIGGHPTGRFNFIYNLFSARGRYIALCEGDDYWTDPKKLQKQVDFLEGNKDFSICFHKVSVLKGDKFVSDEYVERRFPSNQEFKADLLDLLRNDNFIHTPSVVFKNNEGALPIELFYSPVGDYLLHIINSHYGKIKRLDEKMAVYRKGVGIYSTISRQKIIKKVILYRACILSYLKNKEAKEIVLKQITQSIDGLYSDDSLLVKNISFKRLVKLFLLKFWQVINSNDS